MNRLQIVLSGINLGTVAVACGDWEQRNGERGDDDSTNVVVTVIRELRGLPPEKKLALIEYLMRGEQ